MFLTNNILIFLSLSSILGFIPTCANRSSRRQRIQSLLNNQPSSPNFRLNFDPVRPVTLAPVFNRWITWDPNTIKTTTTTPQPTLSPYDEWYYQDDQNYVQGPFSSSTMLEWYKAGYFRSSLMIRREIDKTFTSLGYYLRLYGRVPFTSGAYPAAILLPFSTTSTTTTTTTTTTATTTTTTTTSTTTTAVSLRLVWNDIGENDDEYDDGGVHGGRGDGLQIEDYHNDEDQSEQEPEKCNGENTEECKPSLKDGTIRLVGGRDETEGNVEIYHMGIWGSVCDDEWDKDEANIVCKKLGFPGAIAPTHGSKYGYSLSTTWMDNIYCYGTERHITDCRFDGWGIHDCDRTESAGVRCKPNPPPTTTTTTTTPRPRYPMRSIAKDMSIRLLGGRVEQEGRIELQLDGGEWGVVCGDGWGVREAMVACRQLGMVYAAAAFSTDLFGGQNTTRIISGIACKGNEDSLMECEHDQFGTVFCPGEGAEIAGVACTETQADLEPDLYQLMSSTHLEDKQLFLLQCAMEENCLAREAYIEQATNPHWQMLTRRLLRFTAAIENIGSADFRPFIPKTAWNWHACHQHYHSMETFAHFQIFDSQGNRAAEGHKASFCLEDNDCVGVDPHFDCENYGDQGITPGCKDIYYYNIDCQWIDVTDLPLGTYVFKMAINPDYKVPETTFENNAAICTLYYSQMSAVINNCTFTRP